MDPDYSERAQELMAAIVRGEDIALTESELDSLSDREVYLLQKAALKRGYHSYHNAVTGAQSLTRVQP